jgi:multiple sugar transport system substrate-binding protein
MPASTRTLRFLSIAVAGVAVVTAVAIKVTARPPAPPPVQKRIPVRFWHMWTGEWTPVMNRVVDEFNKSQDKYEVIPLLVPSESGNSNNASSKFLLSVAGGDPPDCMAQWSQAMSAWAQDGILQPLDPLMSAQDKAAYAKCYPVVRNNGWYKGHLYGMVTAFDVYACYYRKDQFRQAGLDADRFPTTLDELTADGQKLDKFDARHDLTREGFVPETFTDYMGAFGGTLYDPRTGQVVVDTPENRRAMQYLFDVRRREGIDQVIRFDSSLNSGDAGNWPFIGGKMSVALDGEWRVQQIAKYAPNLDYGIGLLPPPTGGKPLSSFSMIDYMTIPAGAKHPEGAWEFIKFWTGLCNAQRAAKYKIWFGWLPTSPEMAQAPAFKDFLRQYPQYKTFMSLAASDNIVSTPPVPSQVYLMDRVQAADDLVMHGKETPKQALDGVEADLKGEIARRKELGYDE